MYYDTDAFTAANSGYRIAFHPGERNHCPGCGQSHWTVGRMTAECAFCGTALPINNGGTFGAGLFHTSRKPDSLAA
ncbi:hypothetical protein OK349_06405 [Sphingomonas sp. BT-65]|uniref:hypothetical protein n=1 Tax=Sphingomonas sp. BT-65 TaxID=2989821 RepID=UPI0022357771|nr:hypothetical protein [Sphingomonas sp. BT-65]MCW4461332.1 hypothetical protein [Sphingomonas sp. BT-65]